MPSTDSGVYTGIAITLGLLLLLMTVVGPYATTSLTWTYEYHAEELTPDDPYFAHSLERPEKTAACWPESEACNLAYRVKTAGSQVVSDTVYRAARGFDRRTKLVVFEESPSATFYQPDTTDYDNDTVRVGLTPVSNATALELASTRAQNFPGQVHRLVDDGTLQTNEPLSGFVHWRMTGAIISTDGDYYHRAGYDYRDEGQRIVVRLLSVLLAALCLVYVGKRTA